MAEEQKNGLGETLQAGASMAHAVKGAVKTGKAVSSAAEGAAVGGPYGAVAGALWQGRKQVGKVVIVLTAVLMIPVVILSMLPSLIFGGVGSSYSAADPDTPILNSGTAISENANEIAFTVSGILGEGLDDVISRIESDFTASGADRKEIINPYASSQVCNTNMIVGIYCASKDQDIGSISFADMADALRNNKQHLYSFTWREEVRELTQTDPDTGEESTIQETWRIYTIVYNGETYFADHVFSLTEEQRDLAADYAYNLSLFLSDGLFQNLNGWTGSGIPSLGDVRFTDGVTEVVYYNQLDERYAGEPYGTDNIGGYGCGPTAMAIVVSSLAGETVDPVQMAAWSYENGYWCSRSGSYHAMIPAAAENWGLVVEGCSASEPQRILDALVEGKLVVAIMSRGHFTSSGHVIVLRGVQDGRILVADPASYNRSGQLWDLSIILGEASRGAAAGGPFWIIG